MVPNFLTFEVISGTASKTDSKGRSSSMEKENVYGIFENDEPKTNLRRSIRLYKKKTNKNLDDISEKLIDDDNGLRQIYSSNLGFSNGLQYKHKPELKRKCKSLINEINQRYAEIEIEDSNSYVQFNNDNSNDLFSSCPQNSFRNSNNFTKEDAGIWKCDSNMNINGFCSEVNDRTNHYKEDNSFMSPFSGGSFTKYEINSDFCSRFFCDLIDDGVKQNECKNKLIESFQDFQNSLRGYISKKVRKIDKTDSFETNYDPLNVSFNFVPQTDWQYLTPTKAKIVKKDKKRSIQPAIVYRDHNNHPTDIFELKPEDITIDVTKFKFQCPSPQNVHLFNHRGQTFNPICINYRPEANHFFQSTTEPCTFARTMEVNLSQQSNNSNRFFLNFDTNKLSTENVFGNIM